MNQVTIALLGVAASLVAVWAESRNRNQQEVARDGAYWRDSSQALAGQLQAMQQRCFNAEDRCDKLEEAVEQLKAWARNQVASMPDDPEEEEEELPGPEGFLRSLWRLIY